MAYDDSKVVVGDKIKQYVKVADEVPSWATIDVPIKVWLNNGLNDTATPENYKDIGNGNFGIEDMVFFIITTDGLFQKKGVYFESKPDGFYVTGIASADSDTPEITWDGDIGVIKKLDEKFLPGPLILYVHESESERGV